MNPTPYLHSISLIKPLTILLIMIFFNACAPKIPTPPKNSQVILKLNQSQEKVTKNWWESFNDPHLIALITKAREYNTQNQIARTHIDAAKSALKIARSTLYPSLDLSIAPEYSKSFLHPLYGLGQAELDFSYHLDIFGKYRHQQKSKFYAMQASIAQSYATLLEVDMLVAKNYFQLSALEDQLDLLYDTLKTRKDELDIIEDRKKAGYISSYDTQQAKILFESAKAQIADTKLAIIKVKNALEYLTGIDSKDIQTNKNFKKIIPPKLPKYISSTLLNNRPDVLYAEFRLASSNEYLKKVRADFLPDFNIGLNLGALGLANFTKFLTLGGVTGSILTPLFKGGELRGEFGVATADMNEAAYIYKDTVIKAYQEAKDAHASIIWLQTELKSLKKEEYAAREALKHARSRYNSGYSSYLEVIDAQRSLLELQINIISLKNTFLEANINLYGALGGSFEISNDMQKALEEIHHLF